MLRNPKYSPVIDPAHLVGLAAVRTAQYQRRLYLKPRLAAAARTACQAPLAMLEHCAQAALLLPAALETASPLLRSDVGCAAALCRAAAEAAAMNVLVNTGLLAPDDRTETETRAEHLRATVAQSCAQTVDAVRAALRGEG